MTDTGVKDGPGGTRGGVQVVMTLDGAAHAPDAPLLYADDLAVLRGDGVFETVLVRGGTPRLLDAHVERLAGSARMLELPSPDKEAWRRMAKAAAARWGTKDEGVMRLVLTRGRESGGGPTGFALVSPLPARSLRVRKDGLAVITMDCGRSVETAGASPWLLAGAKSISYASNMAALRYAERQGAGDVILVSSEGYVLEGPRSTVVIARDGGLISPPVEHGILPGTTQHALFEAARERRIACRHAPLRPADLIAAEGVWLLSSTTLVASVRTVNGVEIGRSELDGTVRSMVETAVGGGAGTDGREAATATADGA
ncbi:aminodeoxychorismate lyase [Tomitella fengzijianii]|uniref:Aminodeoxychorismate lyase n=1 Tax=Tomitella fengzijianii TaxID=2597660 RepID=A0A516X1F1_9ACTN|nr:aminodeoxychorismate lyase [Tomitella fengzijianii]QDQ96860.1 aminodeoxychorismate lyase [Tomitella fengzijianii]